MQTLKPAKTAKYEIGEYLPEPHNGSCDRIHECHYASPQCRKPLSDYSLNWKDWESTPLPAAPNRRWIFCAGWKWTLDMVFNKRSGSWVYPSNFKDVLERLRGQMMETLNDLEKGYSVKGMVQVALDFINEQLRRL